MKNPYLYLLAAFLMASISCIEKSTSVKKVISIDKSTKKFYLEYTSPDKKITIDNTMIFLTETMEEYNNPVSSVPSKRTEVTKKGSISQASLDNLTKLIKTNGFLTLKKTVYGPLEEDRYYPYTLYVKTGNKEKKVDYRSNPSFETAPKEFSEIEIALEKMSKEIKKWEIVPGL